MTVPDDFQVATKCESLLQEMSDLPSSDATVSMGVSGKRKKKPIQLTDFTDWDTTPPAKKVYEMNVTCSPPPPPLDYMATCSIGTSPPHGVAATNMHSSCMQSPTNFISPPNVDINVDGALKDFMSATCNALVRIREEIHGLRLDINALRYQITSEPVTGIHGLSRQIPHADRSGSSIAERKAGGYDVIQYPDELPAADSEGVPLGLAPAISWERS
ncbi:hypothetical protein AHF37_10140 [Paragonimus kellicotti]|nr:hypothetical protein AHF37_10140 [Paragonimus kellicotti]